MPASVSPASFTLTRPPVRGTDTLTKPSCGIADVSRFVARRFRTPAIHPAVRSWSIWWAHPHATRTLTCSRVQRLRSRYRSRARTGSSGRALLPVRARPVFNLKSLETREVPYVDRDDDEIIHSGDRCDLAVHEGCGSAERLEASPFDAMPSGRGLIVWKYVERSLDDFVEIGLESRPALAFGKPPATVGEFVPDRSRDHTLALVPGKLSKNASVRVPGDGSGDRVRIEEVSRRQRETSRPGVLSRNSRTKASSSPISSREYFSRKAR